MPTGVRKIARRIERSGVEDGSHRLGLSAIAATFSRRSRK